ncbi:MAG: hypothetical protein RIQ75_1003, partial [Pseudomonadota bacterium]
LPFRLRALDCAAHPEAEGQSGLAPLARAMESSCTSDIRPIATFARWVTQAAPRTFQWLVALFFIYVMATILSLVSLVPVLALSGIVGVDKRPGSAGAMLNHWLSYLGNAAVPLALGRYFFIAATAAATLYSLALRTRELRETCLLHLRQDTYRTLLNTCWQEQVQISDADSMRILTEEAGRIALVIELAASGIYSNFRTSPVYSTSD